MYLESIQYLTTTKNKENQNTTETKTNLKAWLQAMPPRNVGYHPSYLLGPVQLLIS